MVSMDFAHIGLKIRDKRVYEALVRSPEVSVRKIAEETAINRGSVFESLKSLVAVGLVTRIQYGARTMYRAKDPEVLHEIITEKRQELARADMAVDSYVASFAGTASSAGLFHFTSSYKGDEGLATILRDVLKTCRRDEIVEYRAISSPRVSRYLYNNFPHFTHERVRNRLNVKILRQGKQITEPADYAESRYLGYAPYDTGCYTLIYGDKVAIITINNYNETSGVILDDHNFANVQRLMFDTMWERL